MAPQILRRRQQVGHVGREIGIGEIAAAAAKTGEIKAQHGDAMCRQRLRDTRRRQHVLAASEAMGEQGKGANRANRQIQPRGELLTITSRELQALGFH